MTLPRHREIRAGPADPRRLVLRRIQRPAHAVPRLWFPRLPTGSLSTAPAAERTSAVPRRCAGRDRAARRWPRIGARQMAPGRRADRVVHLRPRRQSPLGRTRRRVRPGTVFDANGHALPRPRRAGAETSFRVAAVPDERGRLRDNDRDRWRADRPDDHAAAGRGSVPSVPSADSVAARWLSHIMGA